jgi:hypothetical protein
MKIKVDFVDKDDRIANLLSNEFIKEGQNRLFPCRHFLDVVRSIAFVDDEVIILG